MHERAFRRAVALGAAALLLVTTTALADTVQQSTDGVALDAAGHVYIGTVAPGATVSVDLRFKLVCSGFTHLDPGMSATVTLGSEIVPTGGAFVAATAGTVGPAPTGWPADGAGCSFPAQTLAAGTPSHFTFIAPMTSSAPGTPYSIPLMYLVSSPKSGAVAGFAFATLDFAVSGDQPPTLHLPVSMTVEGDTTGGAMVTYTATASDPEDVSPPPVSCSPASGAFFGLGLTSVGCSATDSAGQTTSGSFDVSVVDTTPPVLSGVPSGLSLVTYDPAGAAASYALPSAADIVDATPSVACAPAPGSVLPVGTTTVTCTATDHSGNQASASFIATVTYVRLAATFDPPIGPSNVVAVNPGRTLPVKAVVTRDGVPVVSGSVGLSLATCDGTPLRAAVPLTFQPDRWFLGLDTSGLAGCVIGTLALDGHVAGSFEMGASSSALAGPKPRRH